jgi:hypothetical protein
MQADVGKATDIAAFAAHHENRLFADGVREVIARLRNGVCPADAKPFPGKDPRLLQRMEVAGGYTFGGIADAVSMGCFASAFRAARSRFKSTPPGFIWAPDRT